MDSDKVAEEVTSACPHLKYLKTLTPSPSPTCGHCGSHNLAFGTCLNCAGCDRRA